MYYSGDSSKMNQAQRKYLKFIDVNICQTPNKNNLLKIPSQYSLIKKSDSNFSIKTRKTLSHVHPKTLKSASRTNLANLMYTPIEDLKSHLKMQIILDIPIGEVKTYFNCLSFNIIEAYSKFKSEIDFNFLRSKAVEMECFHSEINLKKIIGSLSVFKGVEKYSGQELLNYNDKIRDAQRGLADFRIDSALFDEFFDLKLDPEDVKSLKSSGI